LLQPSLSPGGGFGHQYHWKPFQRALYQSVLNTIRSLLERAEDLSAGADCLRYCGSTSWWEWDGGSRLLFWRWPGIFRSYARDGQPHLWTKVPSAYRHPQPPPPQIPSRCIPHCGKGRKVASSALPGNGRSKRSSPLLLCSKGTT
jgi:hypothetical protein